jgi:class 3 adenylate cyclase
VGKLSRRLPSSTYFDFIRAFSTASDNAIIDGGGIVGDHAGDGMTAFFVVDDFGSASRAVRAAIEVGRRLQAGITRAGSAVGLAQDEVRLRVGAHWGGTLYMGQVITGGRLEVTALGDEVNECARMEQTATGGALLASKALIERLDPDPPSPSASSRRSWPTGRSATSTGLTRRRSAMRAPIAVTRIDAALAS